ncbi:MAG: T9SS type A sorting domain-containing protein [Flavobacteriaceae bacterium]|nr:T9SS type A sorting domain-containing protein [Flavobacteriaceae bacterium]
MNLFEGNTLQQIVVDASHDINGPFNTFFRNRAELYGFFSDSGTMTDSMNVIGNEITNSNFPYGMFNLNGAGHLSYGNNVIGTTTPPGTETIEKVSLYFDEEDLPSFMATGALPMVGYPLAMNEKAIAAEQRYIDQQPVSCSYGVITSTETTDIKSNRKNSYVSEGALYLNTEKLPASVSVYTIDGRLIMQTTITELRVLLLPHSTPTAVYIVKVTTANGDVDILRTVLTD